MDGRLLDTVVDASEQLNDAKPNARPGCWVPVDCEYASVPSDAIVRRFFSEERLKDVLLSLRGPRLLCFGSFPRQHEILGLVSVFFLLPFCAILIWGTIVQPDDPRALFLLLPGVPLILTMLYIRHRTPKTHVREEHVRQLLSGLNLPDGIQLAHVLNPDNENEALSRFRLEFAPRLIEEGDHRATTYPFSDYIYHECERFPTVLEGLCTEQTFREVVETMKFFPLPNYYWTLNRRRIVTVASFVLTLGLGMGIAVLLRHFLKEQIGDAILLIAWVLSLGLMVLDWLIVRAVMNEIARPGIEAYWADISSFLRETNERLQSQHVPFTFERVVVPMQPQVDIPTMSHQFMLKMPDKVLIDLRFN